ncbi:hypothetical protein CPC08DRAFT_717277 [Agrocybe pediades]|nr:hypothetical protein CPC08DRAFT_717277 [Agrocybe pediades]
MSWTSTNGSQSTDFNPPMTSTRDETSQGTLTCRYANEDSIAPAQSPSLQRRL